MTATVHDVAIPPGCVAVSGGVAERAAVAVRGCGCEFVWLCSFVVCVVVAVWFRGCVISWLCGSCERYWLQGGWMRLSL